MEWLGALKHHIKLHVTEETWSRRLDLYNALDCMEPMTKRYILSGTWML